jgi:transcriptional regulator with GAF, ATPase, and Fis domain
MATTKSRAATTKAPRSASKAGQPADPATEGRRKKSKLTQVGDEAKRDAMRKALLVELKRQNWNLTHTATALELMTPSAVIRAIHELGLDDEYEGARAEGKVAPGRPT